MNAVVRLKQGNERYVRQGNAALRERTAAEGQTPFAVVICCADSRVIPEQIFQADVGDLFVIRVAGNVLDAHQLGSIEYAVGHLGTKLVVMLGHTGCGAVRAAVSGHSEGYITFLTDEIRKAIGTERDCDAACRQNAVYGVDRIRRTFAQHPAFADATIVGAVYDIRTGLVEWLPENEPANRRTI